MQKLSCPSSSFVFSTCSKMSSGSSDSSSSGSEDSNSSDSDSDDDHVASEDEEDNQHKNETTPPKSKTSPLEEEESPLSAVSFHPGIKTLIGPGHAKTCLMTYANNKGADQPAHSRSLISIFVVRCLDNMVCIFAITKVSRF